MNQKTKTDYRTAQELLNVEAISGRILWTKDKYLFAFIQCRGADNSLLSPEDHRVVTESLTNALSEQTESYQILSVPRTVDTQGMLSHLRQLRQSCESDTRLKLIDGEISALEELAEDGAKEPLLFVKIWCKAARNADRQLLDRAATMCSCLKSNNVAADIMDDEDILNLCTIHAELGVWQKEEQEISEIPQLPGVKRLIRRNPTPEEESYAALMERITPVGGLNFSANSAWIGGAVCRLYGAIRYPSELSYGWAARIMGATDCVSCITYYPGHAEQIGDALSKSIRTSSRDAAEESDARRRKRFERKVNDADHLIDDLDARGMSLGHFSVVVMPYAQDHEELEVVCRNVISRFALRRIKLKQLTCVQRESWMHISPYYPNQPVIDDILRRIVPLQTLIGGYPFTVNKLRDDNGIYFARTPDRGIVSLDIFYRDKNRTNGNGLVTGVPGVGKSTLLKSLLESMFMLGVRCIVNDPEGEFRELCSAMGGTRLDASGEDARVNLLQLQMPLDDESRGEAEDPNREQKKESLLALHIQHIKTVLHYLKPSITDVQDSLLDRALMELYARYGIDLNSDESCLRRSSDQWPVLKELWEQLLKMSEEEPRCEEVALLLEPMAVGSESVIWNGHTNIDLSNPLVVIDTSRLSAGSPRNKAAQYYNLLRMEFTTVSADAHTRYLIIADEAQTLFDPELPQAAAAIKNMALRVRKYEGCLWLAFHSVHELLAYEVRREGQPILDAAAYKILFGTDGRNLADTVELFKLTAAEEKSLEQRQRGKALAIIGTQHMELEFEIPAYRLALMGKRGGR